MPLIEIYPDRESWLDGRKQSIGGSDAYKAAFEPFPLWCEKTGLVEGGVAGLEFRFRVGHFLEAMMDEFANDALEASGMCVWDPGDYTIFRSRKNGFLTATSDRLWMPEPASSYHRRGLTASGVTRVWRACVGPVEFKTVSPFAVDSSPPFADWTEDEPSTYALLQVQHTLMVMDKPEAMLYALIGFDKLWSYHIHANAALQERLLDAERRFWNHVETGTQPIVSETEASAAALAALFPQDDGTEIELDEEMAWPWFERLESARTYEKSYKEEVAMAQVPIKEAMGAATKGIVGEKGEFIWKTNKRGARPLRLKRKGKA